MAGREAQADQVDGGVGERGDHVRRDVPAQLERLRQGHPGIAFTLHPALGETPRVISALADATIDLAGLGFASGHSPLDGIGT